jgi:uncharacterized protein YbjT (DUF2867 family)
LKVVLFGASGMVGAGVLIECLKNDAVDDVLTVGRSRIDRQHPKLQQLIHSDFFNYESIREALAGRDACFFCLGVSSAGMSEAAYRRLTFDLTLAAAETLADLNPGMTFCYVSGEGTDSTEKGRLMWARVKGQTENRLLAMPLNAFMFRPGYIQPLDGVRSKTMIYQALYTVLAPAYPLLRAIAPRHVTTTRNVGRAMIRVAERGDSKRILENSDINRLADGAGP